MMVQSLAHQTWMVQLNTNEVTLCKEDTDGNRENDYILDTLSIHYVIKQDFIDLFQCLCVQQ